MCGICGVMEKEGIPVDKDMLCRMAHVMSHRGPDDEGYYVDGSVGLGFRRLSIIDVKHGHQPMANEDHSIWVIFNGEIYNHKELRDRLIEKGHQFRTNTDTEVIVHLYEEKGISCLDVLRGMFAFAIWDQRKQELYIVRDHFGIKPLYYTQQNGTLLFASELKGLLSTGKIDTTLNIQSIWNYFTFQYVPDPNTVFANISKVPPAHYLHVKQGKLTLRKYWEPIFSPDYTKPLAYYVEGLEHTLRESVRLHMNADVPQGAFLSSGVDSSAIVALMHELTGSVETFSVGFEGAYAEMGELALARSTSRLFETHHSETEISAGMFQNSLFDIIEMLEEPIADPSVLGLFFVSKLASSRVKVVLSGEGADELFAGYPIYHEPRSLKIFSVMPTWIREGLGRAAAILPEGVKGRGFLQRGATPIERRFLGNAYIFSEDAKGELLMGYRDKLQNSFSMTDAIYQNTKHLDDITRMQMVDLHTWLPGDILMKADKMTMAHSIELRVPFLDREVFDFAAKIPHEYRIVGKSTKHVLRQAVSRILPKEIYDRPKLGFPVPYRQWLRSDLRDFVWDAISSVDGMINRSYLQNIMEEHCTGKRDWGRELWTAMTFIIWHKKHREKSYMLPSQEPNPVKPKACDA